MFWDQISFCILTTLFFTLNASSVIRKFQNSNKKSCDNSVTPVQSKKVKFKTIKFVLTSFTSFNSSTFFVGFVTETYLYGPPLFGNLISVTIAYLFNFIFLHGRVYRMDKNIKTPFEYFQQKFQNKQIKILSTLCSMYFYISFLTLSIWSSATILSTIIPDIPLWASSLILGSYSLFGSLIGKTGYVQSLNMNIFQFVLLIIGLVAGIVVTFVNHASKKSSEELWFIAEKFGRRKFIELSGGLTTRYTLWNQLFALPIPWCIMHSVFLPNFTRYRAVKCEKKSRFLLLSNLPFMFAFNTLLVICGVTSFVYFYDCDPIASRILVNKNQISSYWLVRSLSSTIPSLSGITLSSVLSYSIIQHSAGISLCSKTIYNNIIKELLSTGLKKHLNEKREKFLILILIFFVSITSMLYSIPMQYAKNSILSLFFLFNNSFNSPILGLLLLSILNPYANWFGAFVSLFINLGINTWLGLGALVFSKTKSQELQPNFSVVV